MRKLRLIAGVLVVLLLPGTALAGPPGWEYIAPVDGPVSERFDMKGGPYGPGSHRGIDFAVNAGTDVVAVADGKVKFAGTVANDGQFVTITHDNGVETRYSFLSNLVVKTADRVKQGDLIGHSGSGHPGGPEALHFGAMYKGAYIDPLDLFVTDFDRFINLEQIARQEAIPVALPQPDGGTVLSVPHVVGGEERPSHQPVFGDPPMVPGTVTPADPATPEPAGAAPPPLGPEGLPAIPESDDPAKIAEWWDELTETQREALIRGRPHEIGRLNGIPSAGRSKANLIALEAEYRDLNQELGELRDRVAHIEELRRRSGSSGTSPMLAELQEELRTLERQTKGVENLLQRLMDARAGGKEVYLLEFDLELGNRDGGAVVAFGDPMTAENVGVVVPGVGSRLQGIKHTIDDADRLLTAVFDTRGENAGNKSATIAWLSYDAPQTVPDGADLGEALPGGIALANFVNKLRTANESTSGRSVLISIFGHSYGSTTMGLASFFGMMADNLTFLGSPGAGVSDSKDLKGTENLRVWAATADTDIIEHPADSRFLGADPTELSFGAELLRLDDDQFGHGLYFERDSTGLANMARIMTGDYENVELVPTGKRKRKEVFERIERNLPLPVRAIVRSGNIMRDAYYTFFAEQP